MTYQIRSICPAQKGRYRIVLSDDRSFLLYSKELRRYGLVEGEELSSDLLQQLMREVLEPRAKRRAVHLLEQQDRSERNLRQKLKANGYPQDAIEIAIDYVKELHFLDDARLAGNYIRYHQQSRSRKRLILDLTHRGIDRETIEAAMEEEYEDQEEEQVRILLQKKHYDPDSNDPKEKARIYRFLAYRGYSSSLIFRLMQESDLP